MKKIVVTAVMIATLLILGTGLAYGATGISQWDVDEGLKFCAEYPVNLALNGQQVAFSQKDVPPVIVKETTLIPARALFEKMGGTVTWQDATQSVYVKYDTTEVVLTIGSDKALVNGQLQSLDVPPMIIDDDDDYYGSTMIPVRFTAEALGCTVAWQDSTRSVLVSSPSKQEAPVVYPDDTDDDSDNQNNGQNNNPTTNPDTTNTTWAYEQLNAAAKGKTVFIDIGHGGKDGGSLGHKGQSDQLQEKDVNLPIGVKLNEYLRSAGVNTYLIRSTDIYYTLLERSEKANTAGATIFISIHNNSSETASAKGTEVLYNSKTNAAGATEMDLYGITSKNIAENVQKQLVAELGTNSRGIKNSPEMAVLNKTAMPAIIVEGAFLSNESDLALIRRDDYADRYALAVAKGIIQSMNQAFK
ncbi:hypothetical protein Ami103574_11465 [Aminipila butyrica]|uniref:MurNAc-LAA domain-containing protein n=1 Tax=Aminipila butyrica TaxID=433296 RepID=A0A858BWW8_9FIRM|nr:N-acetylmuramoyl-L-alanine amidase [Aminipila butyrica]QIB69902.1 hypothetical protein Ami103574_11465 [Aminipila butyrica]